MGLSRPLPPSVIDDKAKTQSLEKSNIPIIRWPADPTKGGAHPLPSTIRTQLYDFRELALTQLDLYTTAHQHRDLGPILGCSVS